MIVLGTCTANDLLGASLKRFVWTKTELDMHSTKMHTYSRQLCHNSEGVLIQQKSFNFRCFYTTIINTNRFSGPLHVVYPLVGVPVSKDREICQYIDSHYRAWHCVIDNYRSNGCTLNTNDSSLHVISRDVSQRL